MKETNQFQIFNHPQFGEMTTIQCNDGKVLFKANDVAKALGYSDYVKAVRTHCKGGAILSTPSENQCGTVVLQPTKYIPESDIYRLVMRSKLPAAEKFQDWVVEEVLPSIRKNGAYLTERTIERALNEPDFLIELATNLKKEKQAREFAEERNEVQKDIIEGQEKAIRVLKIRQSFVDYIMSTPSCVCITQIAKEYGLSAVKLNKFLHEKKIQYCVNGQWLLYADYQDKGYMKSIHVRLDNNTSRVHSQWTQKGRLFLYEYLKKYGIIPLMEQRNRVCEFDFENY